MATRTFVGGAVKLADKWSLVIANTWATNDTETLTCNGHDLVVTVGTSFATTDVATAVKQAWESESMSNGASCSPSGGGTTIGEHSQFTATVSSSTVTLTADTAGVEFPAITETESTAGSGDASITHTITATGPNFYANVDNWAEGAAATTGDDMIWDQPVSILYNLDQSAVTLATFTIGPRVTSAVYAGLPFQNSSGAVNYYEGNEDYLKISATVFTCFATSGRLKINFGSVQTAATIHSTGTSTDTGRAAFQFLGTHASNVLNVFGGDVGVAGNTGEVSTVLTLRQTAGTLTCGTGATLTTFTKTGGTATVQSSTTTLVNQAGTLNLKGGTHTLLTVDLGTVTCTGSTTLTALRQNGGTITCGPQCTHNSITKTGGTLTLNAGCTTLHSAAGTTTVNAGSITTATVDGGTFEMDGTGTLTTLTAGDCTISIGPNVTLGTVSKEDGTATFAAGMTTLVHNDGETTVESGNITNLSVLGGTFFYSGAGTIAAISAENCTLDFSGSTDPCTVTALTLVGRPVTIRDPAHRVTWTGGLPTGGTIRFTN